MNFILSIDILSIPKYRFNDKDETKTKNLISRYIKIL